MFHERRPVLFPNIGTELMVNDLILKQKINTSITCSRGVKDRFGTSTDDTVALGKEKPLPMKNRLSTRRTCNTN